MQTVPVRIWDLPTRFFHWSIVLCMTGLLATGYKGGSAMELHAKLGYTFLTLLLFRLSWGIVGGRWSRFRSFVRSPRSIAAYLKGKADPELIAGHSPLAGWSIVAIIAMLSVQIATGLVSDDEIAFTGPLNRFVSSEVAQTATWYHADVGQWLLIAWTLVHLAAVLFYLVRKKQNLIAPMLHGDKRLEARVAASRDDALSRLLAVFLLGASGLFVSWLIKLGA